MLERFSVENYKNFNKKIVVDFTATHDYRFNKECVKNGLLSKAIIYGPNSSGKSNIGFAIFDVVALLTDKMKVPQQLDNKSFLNADSDSKVAKFEYVFKKDETHIRYMYKKTSPTKLAYEELYIDDEKVFSYDFLTNERDLSNLNLINAESLNFDYFEMGENSFSFLRYIANNTVQLPDSYVKFLMNFVSNMLWFRSLQENAYIGLTTGSEDIEEWIVEKNMVKDFQKFLFDMAKIDVELEGIYTNKAIIIEKHRSSNLNFSQCASSGEKALMLFFYWSKRFEQVSFLFVDEFDAFYHFELSWNIVKYVSQISDIQVVFTTHNSMLASNNLLRPDCYFILDKGMIKSFADGTNRELREGHNLEKMLRNGEFNVE